MLILIQSSANHDQKNKSILFYLLENKGRISLDSVASLPNTNAYYRQILQNMHVFIVSIETRQNKIMDLHLDHSLANLISHILVEQYSGFYLLLVVKKTCTCYICSYIFIVSEIHHYIYSATCLCTYIFVFHSITMDELSMFLSKANLCTMNQLPFPLTLAKDMAKPILSLSSAS